MKPATFSCQAKPSAFSPPHLSASFFPPHRARFSVSLCTCGKGPLESVWSFPSSEPLSESMSAWPGLSAFEFLPPASQLVGSSFSPQVPSAMAWGQGQVHLSVPGPKSCGRGERGSSQKNGSWD